jgi:hypothetical protein
MLLLFYWIEKAFSSLATDKQEAVDPSHIEIGGSSADAKVRPENWKLPPGTRNRENAVILGIPASTERKGKASRRHGQRQVVLFHIRIQVAVMSG